MDERLFHRLSEWLSSEAVVLASVIDTRGATPRKGGSRMLITPSATAFSVGGGMAEARVIAAARGLLDVGAHSAEVPIDLTGKPGAAGVCGGNMQIVLRRWNGIADRLRADCIATELARGNPITLTSTDIGREGSWQALPNPRLLIIGAGHCAAALCELAAHLDFDLWVHDVSAQSLNSPSFAHCTRLHGPFEQLASALDSGREAMVVLLNRDYLSDVATLRAIVNAPMCFLGMMGSRKRIAEVLAALPDHPGLAQRLHAPIGIDIDAETPHEIAISILAQLIGSLRNR